MFGDHPLIILFPSQTNWFKVAKHVPQAISNLRAIDISCFKAQILSIKRKKCLRCASYFPPCVSTGGNEQWGTRILSTWVFFVAPTMTYLLSQLHSQLQTWTKFGSKTVCHSLLTTQSANKASASWPLQTQRTRRNSPQEPELKRNGTFLLPKYRKKNLWKCCQQLNLLPMQKGHVTSAGPSGNGQI